LRLLVFADLHLDALFSWARADVARERRQNLRDTLDNIIRLAGEVKADALLCGGDLYEHSRFTLDTQALLQKRFNDCPIPVFLAPGNHDWYGPDSIYLRAGWAPHVTVFTEPRLRRHQLADGLTLWGAAHCAPANTPGFFDTGFRADGGGVHLALFHGAEMSYLVDESSDKAPHAPFRLRQIADAGLHHAFVGHFHRRRDVPGLSYPGNPDPISFGDLDRQGAVVADVDGAGRVTIERRNVAVSTIFDLTLDVTDCVTFQEVRDRMAALTAGLQGYARVTVTGEVSPGLDLHLDELAAVAGGLRQAVVQAGTLRAGYDLEVLRTDPTVRGEFVRMVVADPALADDERRRILVTGLRALDGRTDLEVV